MQHNLGLINPQQVQTKTIVKHAAHKDKTVSAVWDIIYLYQHILLNLIIRLLNYDNNDASDQIRETALRGYSWN